MERLRLLSAALVILALAACSRIRQTDAAYLVTIPG
jgi:hypothetical protein